MTPKSSPITRVLRIGLISGFLTGILAMLAMFFIIDSAWFLLAIPVVMGHCIHKYAHITHEDVETDPNLDKEVGWICAGVALVFIFIFLGLILLIAYLLGDPGILLQGFFFYIGCIVVTYYAYSRGVQAVTDSYYDSRFQNQPDNDPETK